MVKLTEILASYSSDGTMGIAPPCFPNLRSNDFCTLSDVRKHVTFCSTYIHKFL